jgi:hypothetical protein
MGEGAAEAGGVGSEQPVAESSSANRERNR